MARIYTREAVGKIINDENLTADQRVEALMGLQGRALDDGYISKTAAQAAQETALENAKAEWEKGIPKPNIKESDEYKALMNQFDSYKAMQTARASDEYSDVKPKFFDTVYGMIDHGESAKPVKDQLEEIKGKYEEYFTAAQTPQAKPTFGAPTSGSMPTGSSGASETFRKVWGYVPDKKG